MATPRILVCDDQETNRLLLAEFLTVLGMETQDAENGLACLTRARNEKPDVILLDVMMPVMDGFETLRHLKGNEELRHVPVIMLSGVDEIETVARCIEMGAADYLVKPFNPVVLRARLRSSLELKRLHDEEDQYKQKIEVYNVELQERIKAELQRVLETQMATIFALSKLAESRDPETGKHLERIREYCLVLTEALRIGTPYSSQVTVEFIKDIYSASALHDIGKVGIPDCVLQKPGKLTADEFEIMKTHSKIGAETLRDVNSLYPGNAFVLMGIEIAESHHEKWDGSGYPSGLSGLAIPLSARILAVCDVYDALTSKRCYKEAMPHDTAYNIILEGSARHFDPVLVSVFASSCQSFNEIRGRLTE
jgi:putative two-component system response regulator